jgi:hypothetical protein
MNEVMENIKQYTGIDVSKKTRKRNVVEMRSVYFKLIQKQYPKSSLAIIGESLGLDHATVIHSLKNFDFYAKHNPTLNEVYYKMLRMLPKKEQKDIDFEAIFELEKEVYDLKCEIERLKNPINRMKVVLDIEELLLKSPQKEVLKERLEAFCKMNKL